MVENNSPAAFDPVLELVLTNGNGGRVEVDIGNGHAVRFDLTPGKEKLIGPKLWAVAAADTFWQNAPATTVIAVMTWEITRNGLKQGVEINLSDHVQFPRAYMFRTSDRRYGILQIVGFTENPRGVKIRYKMVNLQPGPQRIEHE